MTALQDVENLLHSILLHHQEAVVLFLEGDKLEHKTQIATKTLLMWRALVTTRFEKGPTISGTIRITTSNHKVC